MLGQNSCARVAVDLMGGDCGPQKCFDAVLQASVKNPRSQFVVFGNRQDFKCLDLPSNILFENVEQFIGMNDIPTKALRYGRQSSMAKALYSHKENRVDAVISAGNTGALVALSRHILGLYDSIDKPALCKLMPTHLGKSYMLDLGATINCSAEQLAQFAYLGASLFRRDNGKHITPSVKLLNIGGEHFKGMEVIRDAADNLAAQSSIDFTGFVEGDEIYKGVCDVIVCDGFVGNIALKTSEGVARFMLERIRDLLVNNEDKTSAKSLNAEFKQWQKACDPDRYNGAQLAGVKGTVVKCHGAGSSQAFELALETLLEQLQNSSKTCFQSLLNNKNKN